ncbi:MAG TPA: hypothetical protein VFG04_11660 [Planctomycetaceae bacterium]|jgi:hypothetical protein|nr:hypothetical protein [Planctomycetaceae bacterium]
MHPTFGPIITETTLIVTISVLGGVAIAWAIVFGVISVSRIIVRHRERMAQIGMSLNGQQPGASPQPGADPAYRSEWPRKSAVG